MKLHQDVEILIDGHDKQASLDAAIVRAFHFCLSDEQPHEISIHFYSAVGARAWGGEPSEESYQEDPDASAHQLYVITVENRGRVA